MGGIFWDFSFCPENDFFFNLRKDTQGLRDKENFRDKQNRLDW